MNGFLTRDGISPAEFSAAARKDLAAYREVKFLEAQVEAVTRTADGSLLVSCDRGRSGLCRKLLIATGLFDTLPAVPGMAELFGNGVFQCPYCDGWEVRAKRLVAYGSRRRGYEMARALTAWSSNVVLCSDGPCGLDAAERRALARNRIAIVETPIDRLIGEAGKLAGIAFKARQAFQCDALFFDTPSRQQCNIAQLAGCDFTRDGGVRCDRFFETSARGVFVAGNMTRDVELSIVAAAEGAKAAFAINRALTREDFGPP
jgi:thioredoxin reductase